MHDSLQDVFSFGVVLWEMLCLELPWPAANPFAVIRIVCGGGRPPLPDSPADLPSRGSGGSNGGGLTAEGLALYVDLVKACWAQNPADRLSFAEVIPRLR